ncbi:hypothetical protein ACIKT0_13935 [Hansschlegelia beijingensis]|uniref:hypothetical protein n=1 Tax=Hansschlegelia beijingensis TaxID=1133344 RepID=UPI00387F10A5
MLRKVETPEKSRRPIEAAEAEALFSAAFGGVSHVLLAVSGGADSIGPRSRSRPSARCGG